MNRKYTVFVNGCAVVDMHGLFTYVGAGMAGSCHDMAVLRTCMQQMRFPTTPAGRYYLAYAGYFEQDGFMVPFPRTRYHRDHFEGVDPNTLGREEWFNYCHNSPRNIIEGRFGTLKEWWHILTRMPRMDSRKESIHDNFLLCYGKPFVPLTLWSR